MRRSWVVAVGLLSLVACSGARDLFTARANAAAEAGDAALPAERLGKILGSARGVQLNKESAELVANLWLNYALFAQASADGVPLADSATSVQALWPQLFELRGARWHDTLAAHRTPASGTLADSIYNKTDVRVLQHILIMAQQTAPDSVKARARKQAEGVLAQVKSGKDFGTIAQQVSQDQGSARDKGFLPPSNKGAFVKEFEETGWKLAPGQVSGLVESPFGFHIIRRPPLDEVRERLTTYASGDGQRAADSVYMTQLAKAKKVQVAKGAPAAMRSALNDMGKSLKSKSALATYDGGSFTVADYARWVQTVPPQLTAQIRAADDTALSQFAEMLTRNVLFVKQADSAKIQVTPEEWTQLHGAYTSQIDSLRTELGLDAAAVKDSSLSKKDRRAAAGKKVDDYFDRLISGQVRLRQIPAGLVLVLREKYSARVSDAGIEKALEIARAEQAKAGGTPPAGPMQPAPGPAPVPSGATPPPPSGK